jgi:hypothetical protein
MIMYISGFCGVVAAPAMTLLLSFCLIAHEPQFCQTWRMSRSPAGFMRAYSFSLCSPRAVFALLTVRPASTGAHLQLSMRHRSKYCAFDTGIVCDASPNLIHCCASPRLAGTVEGRPHSIPQVSSSRQASITSILKGSVVQGAVLDQDMGTA